MNKKTVIIIVVVLIIIAAVIFWPKKPSARNSISTGDLGTGGSTGNSNSGSTTGGSGTPSTNIFPLRQGSRGEEVKTVQRAINLNTRLLNLKSPILVEDGVYGPKTSEAIRRIFATNTDNVSKERYDWLLRKLNANQALQSVSTKKAPVPVKSEDIVSKAENNIKKGANLFAQFLSMLPIPFTGYDGEDVRMIYRPVNETFPLKVGSEGLRTRNINIALGVPGSEFTRETESQLFMKFKRDQVDEKLYGHIMEINNQNNALLHNEIKDSRLYANQIAQSLFGFPVDYVKWN